MLDTHSPIPLYHQLKVNLAEQIERGVLKPGDKVPSEAELGEQFQISRTTVRQALGELVNQGLLTRIQGRGTFVAQPRIQQRLSQLTGFTQDMHSRGKQPAAKILALQAAQATPEQAAALHLAPGERVVLLKRLRLADELPMAVETSCLRWDVAAPLLAEPFADRSLYAWLREQRGVIPTRARQQMEAIGCPQAEARLLALRKGSPVLHIHRASFDQFGRPFEAVESYYRGDCYLFQVELTNLDHDGAPFQGISG
jgi:GntR family transcriptional regulator